MSTESRIGIGLCTTGKPLTSFCPPTDQIIVCFSDDELNDQGFTTSQGNKDAKKRF